MILAGFTFPFHSFFSSLFFLAKVFNSQMLQTVLNAKLLLLFFALQVFKDGTMKEIYIFILSYQVIQVVYSISLQNNARTERLYFYWYKNVLFLSTTNITALHHWQGTSIMQISRFSWLTGAQIDRLKNKWTDK